MSEKKVYAYARVSTKKQSLQRQIDNIKEYAPTAEITTEKFTGTTTNRPQWQALKAKALKAAANGDEVTIIFDEVSRMSRNVSEGVAEYFELYNAGIALVFLKERHIDTATYDADLQQQAIQLTTTGDKAADKMINDILGAIKEYQTALAKRQIEIAFKQAEDEAKKIKTRVREGMAASGASAKISETRTGKTYTTAKERQAKRKIKEHSKTFGGSLNDNDCIQLCGVSLATYYKYKKEIREEIAKEEM